MPRVTTDDERVPGIVPDTKNWTWVVERPCPECGHDSATVGRDDVAPIIRANAQRWARVLALGDTVHRRPRPDRWSPLEYACHVRDVFRIYDHRLARMLTEDDPTYLNWDQDATAIDERYGEQDPAVVTTDLTAAECRDCRVARDDRADCRFECPCDRVLPVTFVPVEEAFRLSVVLLIRPLPSGRSAKILLLPSKLPAI